jgi:peptidyl-prolyl cis-trans isomerase SurA
MNRLSIRPFCALCLLACLLLGCTPLVAQAPAPSRPAPPRPGTKIPPAMQPGDPKLQPKPQQDPKLRDRVLAVVDEEPILQSDLDRVIALGLAQRRDNEEETAFRRRVLDQLIEERLRFHEMDRFGFEQVPVEEIEAQVAEIRKSFADDAAFQTALRNQQMSLKNLRQLVARQLMVMTYVDEQLGPRVFVDQTEIDNYYETTFTAEMRRRGQPVPERNEVKDSIRAVLKEQRLNDAIEKWTEELRRKADIQVYFDQPAGKLPPVVKKIN